MKTKIFLVDLDGVVLHRPDYFSKRLETIYPSANHQAVMEFFTGGLYKETTLGTRDLAEALSEVLPNWKIDASVDELLKIWFEGENKIDTEVIDKIQKIRKSGIKCVIATDHSKYRKEDIWNNLNMKEYFDDIIASADVGTTKEEPDFYRKSMQKFGIENPEEIFFTDDDPENVEVAKNVGLKAVAFENLQSLDQID